MISSYQPFIEILQSSFLELNKALDKSPVELYEPQRYILSLGGKRIRSLLSLVACDLFDKDVHLAVPAAHALELFHNFSLIHDDIMDNAPLRRGKQTVHEKWDHNIAILSGDSMLVQAYTSLSASEPRVLPDLIKIFNKTAHEVCEGQQLDMNFETKDEVSLDEYTNMIALKTAVLIGCSLQMGAIAAGATTNEQEHLYTFGKELGVAFQIHDDLLDAYAEHDKFGKQVGGDIIANKKTFLLIKSLELANTQQKMNLQSWLKKKEFDKTEKVKAVLEIYDQLKIREYCVSQMELHYNNAISSLKQVSASDEKIQQLVEFSNALMQREN